MDGKLAAIEICNLRTFITISFDLPEKVAEHMLKHNSAHKQAFQATGSLDVGGSATKRASSA
jgi:hypothetical protein